MAGWVERSETYLRPRPLPPLPAPAPPRPPPPTLPRKWGGKGGGWVSLSLNPSYELDIVAHENKPGPNSLITGKITGNFFEILARLQHKNIFHLLDCFLT